MSFGWVRFRLIVLSPARKEFAFWAFVERARLPNGTTTEFDLDLWVRGVWFPTGVAATTEPAPALAFACEVSQTAAGKMSALSIRGQCFRVDANSLDITLVHANPADVTNQDRVRVLLWMRCPLAPGESSGAVTKPLSLSFEIWPDFGAAPPAVRVHQFAWRDEGNSEESPKTDSLKACLTKRYSLPPGGSPAAFVLGSLQTVVPASEKFQRIGLFTEEEGVFAPAVQLNATKAHQGGEAVRLWPFDVVAYDAAWEPAMQQANRFDLETRAAPVALDRDPNVDAWQLRARSFVTSSARPANADATLLRRWQQVVDTYEAALGYVEGGDPGSTVIRPVDHLGVSWVTTYDVDYEAAAGSAPNAPRVWSATVRGLAIDEPTSINVTMPRFVDHAGRPIARTVELFPPGAARSSFPVERRERVEVDVVVGVRDITSTTPARPIQSRIGGLDLELDHRGRPTQTGEDDPHIALRIASDGPRARIVRATASLDWQIASFVPAGQDPDAMYLSAQARVDLASG